MSKILRRIEHFVKWDTWQNRSWSQEGEDLLLKRAFAGKRDGFFVDVGAHHPKRFSNTYLFYTEGWRGINIDAMPGSMKAFEKFRSRDINLEIGVGSKELELEYFIFNEPALNGFSTELSLQRHNANGQYKITKTVKLPVKPLAKILDNHLPEDTNIDFLNIDVEGKDLDVLESNDWEKYRPSFVLVEILGFDMHSIGAHSCVKKMGAWGYSLYAKSVNTAIFRCVSDCHTDE